MGFAFDRRFLRLCVLVSPVALAGAAQALEPATPLARLARQSWTVENGLPQNTVPYLLQARNGFLWAGNEIGLARFDGTNFQVFDHATAPEFPEAEIRCLLDVKDGAPGEASMGDSLWVGTGDGIVRWLAGHPSLLTVREGLPSNSIQSLAQTTDGTIWASTEQGLARWNGHRFEAVSPSNGWPSGSINSMAADGSGGLWLGTSLGISVVRQSKWLSGGDAGVLSGVGRGLVSAAGGGDVLMAASEGIFLAHAGKVVPVLGKSFLPRDGVSFLSRLADGTVAVASKSTVLLKENRKGQAEIDSDRTVLRFAVAQQLPGSRIETIFSDREGNLWVGTNHGIGRISTSPITQGGQGSFSVQLFPASDPLASNAALTFLEDREGDLWVGTETAGLQILRDARFETVGTREGLTSDATTAIVQDGKNALWVGTRDGGLNRISFNKSGQVETLAKGSDLNLTTANGLVSNVILALSTSPTGDLWVGTPDGLNRIEQTTGARKVQTYTSSDGLPDDFIRSLLSAEDGSLWIGTRRGLTHFEHGHFQTFTELNGLGSDLVGAMVRTPDGDLWIATLNGLSRMHNGVIRNYTIKDGLSSNVITALDVTPDGMLWIGTQNDGLCLWDPHGTEDHIVAVHSSVKDQNAPGSGVVKHIGELPAGIHALLHDDSSHLWIASDSGLSRVNLPRLLTCAHGGYCVLNADHFATADGLRSRETSKNSHPTACRSRDGRLWFTTPKGLIVVDPLHFAELSGPPPVVIEHFAVDDLGVDADSPGNLHISAGHLRFQFDYAGLSFAAPQKLRYEYMLEGFDHEWTYAGTRRTAYYTNIPPGPYRFRVRATLGDSGFSGSGENGSPSAHAAETASGVSPAFPEADLSFQLLPHYYQTVWFRAVLILLIAALVIFVFRRRLLRVRREYSVVMAERNRIAREIHDTLAQGYVGISIQLEVLGELLRHNRADAAVKHLALTQGMVREGLDDARQSIWALRSQDAGEHTLPVRMRRLVENAHTADLSANLEVHGAYRALDADVEKEILRIAREAIQNVKRHAAASQLSIHADYDERALHIRITDDGKGFIPEPASAGTARRGQKVTQVSNGSGGHFGLTGMRERAALIHAEFSVISSPGAGTTVSLRVPTSEVITRNRGNSTHVPEPVAAEGDGEPQSTDLPGTIDRQDTIMKEPS